LSALGKPQKTFKTIHIAGTKGKGSTAAMLAAMLNASDQKVGLYTSPHILDIRERIVVGADMISEAAFTRAVAKIIGCLAKARVTKPTYFEVLTAAAIQHFADQGVDIAVIEVGLGGRLDSTNVLQPEVAGITNISFDHTEQLGADLESIAREKAGIIKRGLPVVSAPQTEKVRQILREVAEEVGAPIRFSDENAQFSYRFEFSRSVGRHARICLTTEHSRFEHLHVPLQGEHQAANCGLALTILDTLKGQGLELDDHKAMVGLSEVKMAGRMQIISDQPRILVDGAHNAASVDALMRAIGQNVPYDSMIVIFACHKDKDIPGMLRHLQIGADKMIFTRIRSPRTADPHELAAAYTERCGKMVQVAESLDEAMVIAQSALSREDIICITGSFYLVGEAIRAFGTLL